ncbi:MAG: T9SS type A sorting domain-containing protein [Syntrophothermus sp.]
MMKHFLTVLLVLAAISVSFAQTKTSVTFKVNMGVAAAKGKINVATGKAYLSGTMNGWNATSIPMTRTTSTTDTVYTVTLTDMVVDSVYEYKFLAGSNWELLKDASGKDDDNVHRLYKVKANAADNILPVEYYSNDKTYPANGIKNIKVSFKANMELDIAKGAFDPATDLVSVRAGFNGWSEGISVMKKPLSGTVFSFDTTFAMLSGDNFEYVYTYAHKGNVTWEAANSKLVISDADYASGTKTELRYFNNNDKNSTVTGYTLYLQTDCRNAQADIGGTKKAFPNGIKRIAVVGGEYPMIWPGIGWPDADTSKITLWMNDSGKDGDLVAGDKIWTLKISYPKGAALKIPYKYSINYGMPSENGGANDNELFKPVGDANHWLHIGSSTITAMRVYDVWGKVDTTKITTSVQSEPAVVNSYVLEQNYPNPFNPSTSISYSVPEEGLVTLKIYNLLGQEVATLVNEVQTASVNKVTFDASGLPSGLYIYQLNAKNYTASRKMMLLK